MEVITPALDLGSEVREPQPVTHPAAIDLPIVPASEIKRLVRDIDRTGFGTLEGYVTPAVLAQMRAFVASAVAQSGGEYVGYTTRDAVAGSVFDLLSSHEPFRNLITQVYSQGTGRMPPKAEFYQVLRCLTGQSGQKHSLYFHYDSYVVTALIPVEIPTEGKTGDLIMFPNARRIRSSYWANVVDKILLDNKFTQKALAFLTKRGWLKVTRIRPVPGNIYFFWGYRSVHTNEACDPDKVRATALYHYVNPHAGRSRGHAAKAAA